MKKIFVIPYFYGLLCMFISCYAHAECNSDKWFRPPGPDVKIFVNYEQPDQISLEGYTNGVSDKSRTIPLPADMLTRPWTGKLTEGVRGAVSYYEPDGRGNWRVCRIEDWWPPNGGSEDDREILRKVTKRYLSENRRLDGIPTSAMVFAAKMIFYDKQGRVERVSTGYFEKPEQAAVDEVCFRYDDKDRVLLAVEPTVTKVCPMNEPDARDGWKRYRYAEKNGRGVRLLTLAHGGKPDGSWIEKIQFLTSPDEAGVGGSAVVDSKNGVTLIYGSNVGKLDDNSANTVVNSFGHWMGATYTFTKPPVSKAVLDNPDLIYQYDRRRQTYVEETKMYEFFPSNKHISRDRYYMVDSFVVRHEQLDANGKVVRVITLKNWRQPRPGPHPSIDDTKLAVSKLPLLHEIFHRVYDIDSKGVPTLVAVSWNKKRRLNPRESVPLDMADLVYGTPDGKEKWKTQAEFEKAFNTSAHANSVFPDNPRSQY